MGKLYLYERYKGAHAEFKSVIYPITQLKNSIDDHQLNQISPQLQQILESEQARQMVQERGITLERTKEFFMEKIQEYNSIIDLKHLRSGVSYVTPKKENVFKRHTADQGQITNYHLVLNWQNLNLVFNEIENKGGNKSVYQSQTPEPQKTIPKIQQQKSFPKKEGLVNRLDKKLNDYETQTSFSLTTKVPESRRFSIMPEGTSLLGLNRRNSMNYTARRTTRINSFMKTVSVMKSKKKENNSSTSRQEMIKNYITNSFHQQRKDTDESVRERARSQHQQRSKHQLNLIELSSINRTLDPQDVQIPKFSEVPIYQNMKEYNDLNFEKIKQNRERRSQVIQSVNERYQPKFVHLAGSKFVLRNTFKNQENYRNTMNKLLEGQLNEELKKLHAIDDGIDLEMLEGPPRKFDYHSSNLAQDYNDVKVSKIVQKMKR